MKRTCAILLALTLAVIGCSKGSSDTRAGGGPGAGTTTKPPGAQEQQIPAGAIKFINTEVSQVLAIYQAMSGASLDVDDRIREMHLLIRYENTEPLTRADALHQLEEALHTQAGLVVTQGDSNRVTVRFANSH
jgi:hypothetical protein